MGWIKKTQTTDFKQLSWKLPVLRAIGGSRLGLGDRYGQSVAEKLVGHGKVFFAHSSPASVSEWRFWLFAQNPIHLQQLLNEGSVPAYLPGNNRVGH
ncbi:hypothetical protein GDO78_021462 [Eleutherodactylus coqui]|uniref:Uncharacterized protein n=1 Tax=Eleutherodactylus coqui TaxID=57060 RepID=A0A8J6EH10_ELECQ|nr:hypothetical protein GDO78_021462 [Eleutherodactylus coqui]